MLTANAKARKIFCDYVKEIHDTDYYWERKDAGGMASILRKLSFLRRNKGFPDDDEDGLLDSLRVLLENITDEWVLKNFSVSVINSKFNEIVNQIRNGRTVRTGNAPSLESIGKAVEFGAKLAESHL